MVLGFTQELFSPSADTDELGGDARAALAAMAGALPHLTAMVPAELDDRQDERGWCDSQTEFEVTLDLLLDGLARHLG